ncbi:MAG TPA: glycosyltransferase [Gaiellaceae bacterium]
MIDSVYFLMFPGWGTELRANRWQWARQWAGAVPVVLVQPTQPRAPKTLRLADSGLPNAQVLHVKSQSRTPTAAQAATATGQIAAHLESTGFERPLLWASNPRLLDAYRRLPASARVYHATENHFDMEWLDDEFLGPLRGAIESSDLTVAVSKGVARAIASEVPGARVEEVSNGCDFAFYAGARPDAQLRSFSAPIAIYAGNINGRLDFALLDRLAELRRELTLVFVGPVRGLDRDDTRTWKTLLARPNVRHLGLVHPERLPGLYAAADVGLLPYKKEPLLVRNGFPLKALEMAAAGLPLASTPLDSLVGLATAIAVTKDDEGFVAATSVTRGSLSDADSAALLEVARRNDYAAKFAQVRGYVEEVAHELSPPPAESSSLQAQWRAHASSRPVVAAAASAERGRLALAGLVPKVLNDDLRERVPAPLRRTFARFLTPS